MYVVCVEMEVKPGQMQAFMTLMRAQADNSLTLEAGCRQFDVCVPEDGGDGVLLYEVYDNAAAFQAHLNTTHFLEFDARAAALLAGKSVRRHQRVTAV